MLDYMRQRSRSALIYLFFGIIIAVFIINFGPQSQGCERSRVESVAKVNGHELDSIDLRMEYIRHFGTTSGRRSDDEEYDAQRQETLQTLINTTLLAQEAERLGFVVTREELARYIKDAKRNPDYRSLEIDGKFDPEQYQRLVTAVLQASMERYERMRGMELLARKLVSYYQSLIQVSAVEVQAAHKEKETKVNLQFIAVRPADSKISEVIDEEELKNYQAANKDAIQKYYEEHKSDYDQPKQIKIRQIFLKSEATDLADARTGVKKRAEELRQKIMSGEDMAVLASTDSEHINYKAAQGDMGWVSPGSNEAEFDAAAFALAKGELSQVVETPKGYYLLRAEDVRERSLKTLEEATPEIARTLIMEGRRSATAKQIAEGMLTELRSGKSIEEVANAASTPTPAPASAEGADQPATETPEVATVSYEVQETGDFTQEGRSGEIDPTNIFSFMRAWDTVPRIGRSKDISLAAFALNESTKLPERVFDVNGTFYVIQLKKRTEPPQEIPADQETALRNELLQAKSIKLLGAWEQALFFPGARRMFGPPPTLGPMLRNLLDQLKAQASISRNEEFFARSASQQGDETDKNEPGKDGEGKKGTPPGSLTLPGGQTIELTPGGSGTQSIKIVPSPAPQPAPAPANN